MSSDLTYVPLENPKRGGAMDYTHIRVSVYYYKDSSPRGIVLSVNACEKRGGFTSELLSVTGRHASIYRVIRPMPRGNASVENAVRASILAEIEAKSGPYWDEIKQVVDAYTEQPAAV